MRTIWEAISDATEQLESISESPQLDAELLLRQASGLSRAQIFARYDRPLDAEIDLRFQSLVERREGGESIAYIRGFKGFRHIELAVDRRVLVPRPETERFVDYALGWLARHPGPRRVIDVGTGSGAIALALASELGRRSDVQIVASDRYRDALDVAAANRDRLDLTQRVGIVQADLLSGFRVAFDVILANLPYLRDDQDHPSIRAEPRSSLYGGADGFGFYRRIVQQLPERLAAGGLFVGEIDPQQAALALSVCAAVDLPTWLESDDAGDDRYLLIGAKER